MQETQVWSLGWDDQWQPTPVFLPGESHGQRSLTGYSPQGHRKSDMTERLTLLLHFPSLHGVSHTLSLWLGIATLWGRLSYSVRTESVRQLWGYPEVTCKQCSHLEPRCTWTQGRPRRAGGCHSESGSCLWGVGGGTTFIPREDSSEVSYLHPLEGLHCPGPLYSLSHPILTSSLQSEFLTPSCIPWDKLP